MQLSASVQRAAILAHVQEQLLLRKKQTWNKSPTVQPQKQEVKHSFSPSELWKGRQVKDYRRSHNLCFTCGEKYMSHQLNSILSLQP